MACGQEVGVWAKETIGPLRRFGEEGVEDDSWREAWDQREYVHSKLSCTQGSQLEKANSGRVRY